MDSGTRTVMHINLLGPVELGSDHTTIAIGAAKPRALLAMLALELGSTVSADRLIDGLWGDSPPASAGKLVQLYVSHLRKAMVACGEPGAIATHGRGYQLDVDRDRVDVARFERLLAQGAAREALSLWRGPALAGVADMPFAAVEVRRLDELRATALEMAIEQDLDAGRQREVLPELEAFLAQEPLRERLHAQRMLALYRSGRQADALEAYRHARATLVEEIGVEPGPELRRLHEAILRQDPSLDPPATDVPPELSDWPGSRMPLLGRESELAQLDGLWQTAVDGPGSGVALTGAGGIGKTRLALELIRHVHRSDGHAVYRAAGADPAAALRAVADARGTSRPTLLVVDDLDEASDELIDALGALLAVIAELPLLVILNSTVDPGLPVGRTLELDGLSTDAVGALARFVTAARGNAEIPVDRFVAESGGVPALVQRLATDWARGRAARRLGEAAAHTSAERAHWRAAEDDLATGIVELQALRERTGAQKDSDTCPFKGLEFFGTEDAPLFFGRERLVADMVARLPGTRLMGVIGPSGSGKSSAMRAGLLAGLADGVLPGSGDWPRLVIRPGEHPLGALQGAMAALGEGEPSVLAVDQFEETFTACRDESERVAFIDALVACSRDARRRASVIVALRADFYGHCADYPELSRMLGSNHVLVGAMRRDELRRAIEMPARQAGLRIEPELVDTLIADVEGEPGGLPLLSTSLVELWELRDGRRLHLGAYERTGGVHGAVARLAETAYERFDPDQRRQARRIMLRLAGDGDVRARVPIGELNGTDGGREVLSQLASERLVTVGDGEAEVAHEALLREWPRLCAWLEEDAEGRRMHRHVTAAARDWDAGNRDASELYRGSRLDSASEWAARHEQDLNEREREFLAASQAAAAVEADRERRTNRRLRTLLTGVGALLVLAVIAGAVALSQRGNARDAALVADAQRLGAEALTNERLDQAALLARAGVDFDDSAPTRSNLLSVLLRNPASIGELRGDGWPLYAVARSDDDRLVAIGDERGGVTVYDSQTRRRLSAPYTAPEGLVQQLVFAPDGNTLAVTLYNEQAGHTVVDLIDPRTGTRLRRFELPAFPVQTSFVLALVVFQPNGRDLIVQQTDAAFPGGAPSLLWRLNAQKGVVEQPSVRIGRRAAWNLVTTADRRRVFVTSPGDDATYEIAPKTLGVVRTYRAGGRAGAVTPDGRSFALASADGSVRLLDLASGRVRRFTGRFSGHQTHMAFAPDGRTLVTSDLTGTLVVWDVERGVIRERLSAHAANDGDPPAVTVSADGRTLYSASRDARMVMWDLAGDRRLDRHFGAGPPMTYQDSSPKGLALSPDGRTLAVGENDGTLQLIDTKSLALRRRLSALTGAALAVDFSPDGRTLAVTGDRGQVMLIDSQTGKPIRKLEGLEDFAFSQAVVFSPDGRLIAAGGIPASRTARPPGLVRIWNVKTGGLTRIQVGVPSPSLSFSPDGRLLAAAGLEQDTEIHDVRTGRLVAKQRTGDFARSVAFSPDGGVLAIGHYGGTVALISTESWKLIGRGLDGHRARITALEFAPDGRTLMTGSADGTVRLWDTATQKPIGAPLTIATDTYLSATFSRDGSHLFAVPHEGRAVRFDVRPESWKRQACLVAGRALTRSEWHDALPNRPFRSVCGP